MDKYQSEVTIFVIQTCNFLLLRANNRLGVLPPAVEFKDIFEISLPED